jgi:hypothetical protein
MLLFKRHLLARIRDGTKRQTIRLWKYPRVRPGQITFAPGLGRLQIIAVDTLPTLAALTRADARADGFATKKALLEEIHRLYNPLPTDRHIYRIQFRYPVDPVTEKFPGTRRKTQKAEPPFRAPRTPPTATTGRKSKNTNCKSMRASPQQRQTLRHFVLGLTAVCARAPSAPRRPS